MGAAPLAEEVTELRLRVEDEVSVRRSGVEVTLMLELLARLEDTHDALIELRERTGEY